jgi:hypothetical protein
MVCGSFVLAATDALQRRTIVIDLEGVSNVTSTSGTTAART